MQAPRFSVVVPTRQRADKLQFCLRTCLNQHFDDYEIVVCDNHSSPETREVVEQAASSKIRYLRAPEPLAMSDNWELAVSQAQGEYVLLLGDDDGLLPHALKELDRLIDKLNAKVIRWSAAFYLWPAIQLSGEGNFLRIPLGRQARLIDSKSAIERVITFESNYSILPTFYNAVFHRDLIEEARRRCGRVFGNNCPDVYSGFLFSYLVGEYWSTDVPMTVAGVSEHSNGIATLFLRNQHPISEDYRNLNQKAGLQVHPWVPDLPLYPYVAVADSFQHAKEGLFPQDDTLCLDRKALIMSCLKHLVVENDEQWQIGLQLMRNSLVDDQELLDWFDRSCQDLPRNEAKNPSLRTSTLGHVGDSLCLNADELGALDVAGTCELCDKILNYSRYNVRYQIISREVGEQTDETEALLREKENVIRNLSQANAALHQQLMESHQRAEQHVTSVRDLSDQVNQLHAGLASAKRITLGRVVRGLARRALRVTGLRRV